MYSNPIQYTHLSDRTPTVPVIVDGNVDGAVVDDDGGRLGCRLDRRLALRGGHLLERLVGRLGEQGLEDAHAETADEDDEEQDHQEHEDDE